MAKFTALLKNEFIKSWSRITVKLMIPLLIVITAAVVCICSYSDRYFKSELTWYYQSSGADYSMQIRKAQEMKNPGYELEIEYYTFLQENNIPPYDFDWRYLATAEIFRVDYPDRNNAKAVYPEVVRKEVLPIISEGDWKDGCRMLIKLMKEQGADKEEYWEYEYRLKNNYPFPETIDDMLLWYNGLITSVRTSESRYSSCNEDDTKAALFQLDNHISINTANYRSLISDTNPAEISSDLYENLNSGITGFNIWTALNTSVSLIILICLFISVIACSSVTSEYSSGTVKFLLINPVKRWKILMAKYFMCLLSGLIMTVILFAVSMVVSVIVFGSSDLSAPYICIENGEIAVKNSMVILIRSVLLSYVKVVEITSLAFALSTLIPNAAASSGITMFAVLGGSLIVSLLKEMLRQDWARYLFAANMDLEKIIRGGSVFNGHTVGFAVAVLAVHTFVFMLIAWDAFTKKEI